DAPRSAVRIRVQHTEERMTHGHLGRSPHGEEIVELSLPARAEGVAGQASEVTKLREVAEIQELVSDGDPAANVADAACSAGYGQRQSLDRKIASSRVCRCDPAARSWVVRVIQLSHGHSRVKDAFHTADQIELGRIDVELLRVYDRLVADVHHYDASQHKAEWGRPDLIRVGERLELSCTVRP